MAVSKSKIFVKGVWGPYYGAMLPGYWLNEGGQSATGALLDHVIKNSEIYDNLLKISDNTGKNIYEILNEEVENLKKETLQPTGDVHVLDYFHGNRSPRADSDLKGMISGLTLNRTIGELAKLYLATIQAIAYGSRHIIETLNENGHTIKRILMCGGGTKNLVWIREHADILGCDICLPGEPEAVLLGAAILAASTSGCFNSIFEAMSRMCHRGKTFHPNPSEKVFHDKKYRIFLEMYNDQMKYKQMME